MVRVGAGEVVWRPTPRWIEQSNQRRFTDWLRRSRGLELDGYEELRTWSIADLDGFWRDVWEYYRVGEPAAPQRGLADPSMPGASWFPGTHVNLAEYALRPRAADDAVAVVGVGERGGTVEIGWQELRRQVGALAATLTRLGVRRGDVVAGYLPNVAEAVVAVYATASLGAVWSGIGQDYAPAAALRRLSQLEPVALIAADGHVYNGRERDNRAAVDEVRAGLPSLRSVIGVSRLGPGLRDAVPWAQATAGDVGFSPVATSFEDPLWVLFSSGTTGIPKGIVHSQGGVTLQQSQVLDLNWDMRLGDRFFWFTSPSWVLWNMLIGALGTGAGIVCYDGAPMVEGPDTLWRIAAQTRTTILGTNPGHLIASEQGLAHPAAGFDLSALRIVGSSGAPLGERSYRYLARELPGVPVFSMSGGTDISGAFVLGSPTVPVYAGEISVRGLGVALEAWDADGRPRTGEVGELVVTQPMPAMPLGLWNDADGSRFRAAYFADFPGVWRHGDWITLTERGSVVVHGRSDSTLNRGGVRMGTADIYAAVEALDEVAEALVIGVERPDGGYWMPLFVALAPGRVLDETLVTRIGGAIRERVSPRHVPDEVIAVRGIPHTKTGKKLEVPIKRLAQGAPLEEVVDPSVVDAPELLGEFVSLLSPSSAGT